MILNKETVIKALEGVLLIQNPVLWETSGRPNEEHYRAMALVHENIDDFRQLVLTEL